MGPYKWGNLGYNNFTYRSYNSTYNWYCRGPPCTIYSRDGIETLYTQTLNGIYSKRLDGQYKDLFGVKQPQRKNYKPQLVHDFSHQQYHGQIIVKSPETTTNLTGS